MTSKGRARKFLEQFSKNKGRSLEPIIPRFCVLERQTAQTRIARMPEGGDRFLAVQNTWSTAARPLLTAAE